MIQKPYKEHMRTSLKIYANQRTSMKVFQKFMKITENRRKFRKIREKKKIVLFSLCFVMFFKGKLKKPDFSWGRGGSGGRVGRRAKVGNFSETVRELFVALVRRVPLARLGPRPSLLLALLIWILSKSTCTTEPKTLNSKVKKPKTNQHRQHNAKNNAPKRMFRKKV